jgi:alkylglycerol monooxygenase
VPAFCAGIDSQRGYVPVSEAEIMKALDLIYILAALLAAEAAGLRAAWLTWMVKPLLMPLLAAGAFPRWTRIPGASRAIIAPLLAALFCAFLGDVLLMFESLFLPGVAAFLAMQAVYSYLMLFRLKPVLAFPSSFAVLVPVLGVSLAQYQLMSSRLGPYRYPMVVYLCFLTMTLASAALLAAARKIARGTIYLLSGAILFYVSDNLIALDRFLQPIPAAGFWIMATYASAQWLMVRGFLLAAE